MYILDLKLFFGFEVEASLEDALTKANSHAVQLFINNSSEYLHEVIYEGKRYIGKFVGQITSPPELELLQANIYSITKKLAPNHNFILNPAVLLVTTEQS
ncbi:MAG: hypothetical protein ACI9S8_001733 [Chlamydiales bacterium]|jgi:hypothetical protein